MPAEVVLRQLYDADRETRRRAAAAITQGLRGIQRTTTFAFNTLLAEKASDDRLRSYPTWITARNMDNQVDDATVDALVGAVTSRYDIVARYYRLKKRLLGLEELFDYDRYAALPAAERRFTWAEARDIVLAAYRAFHPRMAEIAGLFFEKRWIDAAVHPGKRGGAFSSSTVPSVHPYILVNFQGTAQDVMTLAHELGHGVHQYLARDKGVLQQNTPLTTAETASIFGETLVFHDLISREKDPAVVLSMLVREIESSFATVFRQVAMNRFEEAAHTARRTRGELTTAALSEPLDGDPARHVRRQRHADRRLRDLVELHHALHPRPGVRLRLRVRRSARARAVQPLAVRRQRTSRRGTSPCSPPAARTGRRPSSAPSAWTWPTPASGARDWRCWRRW